MYSRYKRKLIIHFEHSRFKILQAESLERVAVRLADDDLAGPVVVLGKRFGELLSQNGKKAALRVGVAADNGARTSLREVQQLVVAQLAGDVDVCARVLEHGGAGARAHGDAADLSTVGAMLRRARNLHVLHAEVPHDARDKLAEAHGRGQLDDAAHARGLVARDARGARRRADCARALVLCAAGHAVGEPVVDAADSRVDGGVRAVHGDAGLREAQQ